MKQYRFTSANFIMPGETGDDNAIMDPEDLARIKKLAGIVTEDFYTSGGHDPMLTAPNDCDSNSNSPVGSNTGTNLNKKALEKQNNIKPGSNEWFRLWFTKPELTGEKPIGDAPAPTIKKIKD